MPLWIAEQWLSHSAGVKETDAQVITKLEARDSANYSESQGLPEGEARREGLHAQKRGRIRTEGRRNKSWLPGGSTGSTLTRQKETVKTEGRSSLD